MAATLIDLRQRGGLAGLSRRLQVADDGAASLRDRRHDVDVSFVLEPATLTRLRERLSAVDDSAWSRPGLSLGGALMWMAGANHLRVQLRHGGRVLAETESEAARALVAEVDAILADAVRRNRERRELG